jgi:hypothetical protein
MTEGEVYSCSTCPFTVRLFDCEEGTTVDEEYCDVYKGEGILLVRKDPDIGVFKPPKSCPLRKGPHLVKLSKATEEDPPSEDNLVEEEE